MKHGLLRYAGQQPLGCSGASRSRFVVRRGRMAVAPRDKHVSIRRFFRIVPSDLQFRRPRSASPHKDLSCVCTLPPVPSRPTPPASNLLQGSCESPVRSGAATTRTQESYPLILLKDPEIGPNRKSGELSTELNARMGWAPMRFAAPIHEESHLDRIQRPEFVPEQDQVFAYHGPSEPSSQQGRSERSRVG